VVRWYRISDGTWARVVARAAELDELSDRASNTRRWSPDFNLLGAIGEELYGAITGLPVDRAKGIRDGGTDFPGVDVKASRYWREPLLRLKEDELKAPVYWLCGVDLGRRRARPAGYATRLMLREAPVRDFGHGECRVLGEADLLDADGLWQRMALEGAYVPELRVAA
jgi:hypothetical protein